MNITKVPCLAFIVSPNVKSKNNGRIVTVLRRFMQGEKLNGLDVHLLGAEAWLVESCGSPLTMYAIDRTDLGSSFAIVCADSYLREIKGDNDTEDTETDAPIEHGVAA